MKMSDVFELPVSQSGYGIDDCLGRDIGCIYDNAEEAAIVHAINQHDQLTAINQELVEALELATEFACDDHACSEDFFERMNKLIKRAKELTNEG